MCIHSDILAALNTGISILCSVKGIVNYSWVEFLLNISKHITQLSVPITF